MNRDDVLRLAEKAGFRVGPAPHPYCIGDYASAYGLERFAALVAAAEREDCAEIARTACESWCMLSDQTSTALAEVSVKIRARTNP